jgi:hypothetical protein
MKRGVGLLAMVLTVSCNSAPRIVPLTARDCPEGASVAGAAPPGGDLQRCELPGGVRHGKSRAWFDNGRPRYETEWSQGKKHGKFTLWHPNGHKRAEGEDRHGVPVGTWTTWAENGIKTEERVFTAAGAAPATPPTAPPATGPARSRSRGAPPG